MKQISILALSITLIACNNNEPAKQKTEAIEVKKEYSIPGEIQKVIDNEFTSIEKKGLKIIVDTISDREALNEILDYQLIKYKKAGYNLESVLGSKYEKEFRETLNKASSDLDLYKNLIPSYKGEKEFKKISTVKINTDTVHHGIFYVNENDSIVKYIHLK